MFKILLEYIHIHDCLHYSNPKFIKEKKIVN